MLSEVNIRFCVTKAALCSHLDLCWAPPVALESDHHYLPPHPTYCLKDHVLLHTIWLKIRHALTLI